MVPMKAMSRTSAMCRKLGNASPVSVISAAPASISVRRSRRGAMAPTASVNAAVPSSEAVSTSPVSIGP